MTSAEQARVTVRRAQGRACIREIVYDPPLALRTACVGAEGSKSWMWIEKQQYVICLYRLSDISIITNSCIEAYCCLSRLFNLTEIDASPFPSRRAFFRFDMHTAILTTAFFIPAYCASGPAACRRRWRNRV